MFLKIVVVSVIETATIALMSLNPCSNGKWSRRKEDYDGCWGLHLLVLILVLMECKWNHTTPAKKDHISIILILDPFPQMLV